MPDERLGKYMTVTESEPRVTWIGEARPALAEHIARAKRELREGNYLCDECERLPATRVEVFACGSLFPMCDGCAEAWATVAIIEEGM